MTDKPTTQTDGTSAESAAEHLARLRAEHVAGLRELQAGRDRVLARTKRWTQPDPATDTTTGDT